MWESFYVKNKKIILNKVDTMEKKTKKVFLKKKKKKLCE